MKKNIRSLLLFVLPFLAIACEQDIEVYNQPDNRIYFTDTKAIGQQDSVLRYTFVYFLEEVQVDTVWLQISTTGFVTDYPRPFALKQVMTGEHDAIAGKHYVDFKDPEVIGNYVIPAGKAQTRVPLIVKRDDPGLDTVEMNLRLTFEENEHFKLSFQDSLYKTVTISDILTQPVKWDFYASYYMVGDYGKEKHRFMMKVAAPMGVLINDKFFEDRVSMDNPDMGIMTYWFALFYNALEEENAKRKAEGKDVLREAPEPGETIGKEVKFTQFVM